MAIYICSAEYVKEKKNMEFLNNVPMPILMLALAIFLLVAVVLVFQYIKLKGLEGIRVDVYNLILKAEHTFEHGDNTQKLEWVVQKARSMLPRWISFFITTERLTIIIEMWFRGVKDLLDDGRMNNSQEVK